MSEDAPVNDAAGNPADADIQSSTSACEQAREGIAARREIELPEHPRKVTRQVKILRQTKRYREARELLEIAFARWPDNAIIANNLIIAHRRQPEQAWQVYREMRRTGAQPDAYTFSNLIKAFGDAYEPDRVWEIYQEMLACGV